MQARVNLKVAEIERENNQFKKKDVHKRMPGFVMTLKAMVSKYVTFDKDAISKDPHWPHLWN